MLSSVSGRRRTTLILIFGSTLWLLSHYASQTHFPVKDVSSRVSWLFGNSLANMPYSAAIIYLVETRRQSNLLQSLSYIHSNLPSKPWPIILFHTGDYDTEEARHNLTAEVLDFVGLVNNSRALVDRLEFERLNWTLPPGISDDVHIVQPVFEGYHHMCAFFTSQIFSHPRLQDVTYYMRLDTDSYIEARACYDPIDRMYQKNLTYASRYTGQDPPWVIEGLWTLLDGYARSHPKVDAQLTSNKWNWPAERDAEQMPEYGFPGYYNNFEIVKLDAFRRPDVQDWLEEVRKVPERFYKYRWGDAVLRFATVHMFFDTSTQTEEFCALPFFHQGNPYTCPCPTEENP